MLFRRRLLMSMAGVFITSFAVGLLHYSGFGVDPFQSLALGMWGHFFHHVAYGAFWAVMSAVILLFDLWYDRHNIGAATFINLFLAGYVVDASEHLAALALPDPSVIVRTGLLIGSLIVICFGSSLYMTAEMGVSVYDATAISISKKHPIPFRLCRILTDIVCVVLAALCGQMPGIGTLLTALCMGPLVDWFNRMVSQPMLRVRNRVEGGH